MPRNDTQEEKDYNKKDTAVEIVTQDQLTNYKLDVIIENQKLLLKNQALILKLAKE